MTGDGFGSGTSRANMICEALIANTTLTSLNFACDFESLWGLRNRHLLCENEKIMDLRRKG